MAQNTIQQIRTAKNALKHLRGKSVSERLLRKTMKEAGIHVPPRPKGIPDNFIVKIAKKTNGIKYIDPKNPHTSVRVMPAKPGSIMPAQRKPYVKYMRDGKAYDKSGNVVLSSAAEAHIPIEEFEYK